MAYQINRFNRSLLTTVEDGTLDETTDIKFVGKNYAGYGEAHNENFLFLLENFSGANEPPKPISGQLWFDTAAQRMKFRDSNNKWRTVGGAEVSASQPAGLATGDFWWDSGNEQLYVFNGTEFILIGPQDAGDGITQMVSQTVIDTTDVSRSVIVAYINDVPVHVISPNEFTIKNLSGNNIDGFGTIRQGITLRDTDNENGETTSQYRFHGTATNAVKLGGLNASEFARTGDPSFDVQIEAAASGIIAGGVFSFSVEDGIAGDEDYGVLINNSGPDNDIRFRTQNAQGSLTTSIRIKHDGVFPIVDNTIDLGGSSLKFNEVYATSFKGIADKALELRHGTSGDDYRYASEANVAGTIAVRDSDKTITADIFNGIASQARFADLAEKYTVEHIHPVGTVMAVCEHEDHEICPCKLSGFPVGVISAEPAFLMNKDLEGGQAIALEGRVPVRVLGTVKKGDILYVDAHGCASTTYTGNPTVGVALESSDTESEKLVEAILKL